MHVSLGMLLMTVMVVGVVGVGRGGGAVGVVRWCYLFVRGGVGVSGGEVGGVDVFVFGGGGGGDDVGL